MLSDNSTILCITEIYEESTSSQIDTSTCKMSDVAIRQYDLAHETIKLSLKKVTGALTRCTRTYNAGGKASVYLTNSHDKLPTDKSLSDEYEMVLAIRHKACDVCVFVNHDS